MFLSLFAFCCLGEWWCKAFILTFSGGVVYVVMYCFFFQLKFCNLKKKSSCLCFGWVVGGGRVLFCWGVGRVGIYIFFCVCVVIWGVVSPIFSIMSCANGTRSEAMRPVKVF